MSEISPSPNKMLVFETINEIYPHLKKFIINTLKKANEGRHNPNLTLLNLN